jgi:hypothetical protein
VDYYRGFVEDWRLEKDKTVTLVLRDFSKAWKDVPIPSKWQTTNDNKVWTTQHPIDVMMDVLTGHIGVQDKFIDRDSFNNMKLATSSWTVTRTLTGKTYDCKEIMEELRRNLCAFFIPRPDGRVRLRRWDPSETSVMDLTDAEMMDIGYDANSKSLINRSYTYFNNDETGEDAKNFSSLDINIDSTSQSNWGETKTEEIKDYWTRTAQASQVADLSNMLIARFKDIPDILTFELDIRFMALEVGDLVNITTKHAPSSDLNGISNVKYQIVNRDLDFKKDRLKLKALRTA